jgi:hypothetical protein
MVQVVLRFCLFRLQAFLFLLILVVPLLCSAAESSPTLTVTTMDAHLYARQDNESQFIATLEKGEKLQLLAQGLGNGDWYMVKTSTGMIGWAQSADVSGSNRLDETFSEIRPIGPQDIPTRTAILSKCLKGADAEHQAVRRTTQVIQPFGSPTRARHRSEIY